MKRTYINQTLALCDELEKSGQSEDIHVGEFLRSLLFNAEFEKTPSREFFELVEASMEEIKSAAQYVQEWAAGYAVGPKVR